MAPTLPRGIRNNNPGNIDFNKRNNWEGQLGIEDGVPKPRFAKFATAEDGCRAIGKLLLNYRGKSGEPGVGKPGVDTVQEIIHIWAPPNENDTAAYVKGVAGMLGVSPTQPIVIADPQVLYILIVGIITHENGSQPYDPAVIRAAVARALK